jgi:hypothetical protein
VLLGFVRVGRDVAEGRDKIRWGAKEVSFRGDCHVGVVVLTCWCEVLGFPR